MAKKGSDKAYKAAITGTGLHRIDGIVRGHNEAGVVIDIKENGRIVRHPTLIPMADIVAHTKAGAGFVICDGPISLEPIAGTVIEENADEIVLQDADGNEIHFPLKGRTRATFRQVAEDDRSLKKGAVETKIMRLAEREDGSSGKKKKNKDKSSGDDSGSRKKKKKAGLRRKAK